jgi:hypothetical protein
MPACTVGSEYQGGGHISSSLERKHRSTKIRFPLVEVSLRQLKPSPILNSKGTWEKKNLGWTG